MSKGRIVAVVAIAAALLAAPSMNHASATTASVEWAYPGPGPKPSVTANPHAIETLPGSQAQYTRFAIDDGDLAIDWHPRSHAALPPPVRKGRPPVGLACGYCHLPEGIGRPENAAVAGLPVSYIVAQVTAMRDGARSSLRPAWAPAYYMIKLAHAVTPVELRAAAAYFSHEPFRSHERVVEAAEIPRVTADAFAYRTLAGSNREALGDRIIETPADFARFDLRDDTVDYVAYVPPGSIARGRALATNGPGGGAPACTTCHGAGLRGSAIAPPLAGRWPTGLFRQLEGFRAGVRRSAAMQSEVAHLSTSDAIALAAYAGSLAP